MVCLGLARERVDADQSKATNTVSAGSQCSTNRASRTVWRGCDADTMCSCKPHCQKPTQELLRHRAQPILRLYENHIRSRCMSILSVTRQERRDEFRNAGMLHKAREAYHAGCNQKHMLPPTRTRLCLLNQSQQADHQQVSTWKIAGTPYTSNCVGAQDHKQADRHRLRTRLNKHLANQILHRSLQEHMLCRRRRGQTLCAAIYISCIATRTRSGAIARLGLRTHLCRP